MPVSLAEVEGYLTEMSYPVYKEKLLMHARAEGANDAVLIILDSISNRAFANSPDVIPELIGVSTK